ncbi:hypothetical protein BCR35DRAFT_326679 [Leucosporidium creatinivorum]|uniref:Zn(2)-C6 fungal-type domain-containing protein n=1 Tax=Leucosporidium creatinivorum TaxID=106004 RepID=A0A1Y2DU98_9BASI|nr:hypothetical protein BCR35DRAFT_326679 [Leucosporidium creatinivorum]
MDDRYARPPPAHHAQPPPTSHPSASYAPYWGYDQEQQLPSPQQATTPYSGYTYSAYGQSPLLHMAQQQLPIPRPAPPPPPPPLQPAFHQPFEQQQQQPYQQQQRWDDSMPSPEQLSPREGPNKKKRSIKQRSPPPPGVVITEKSCLRCRVRKVRCNREFPRCSACIVRNEECDLISLHPNDKQSASARDAADSARIARLEARLAELEGAAATGGSTTATSSTTPAARPTDSVDGAATSTGDDTLTAAQSTAGDVAGNLSPRLALAQLKAIGDDLGPSSVDWRLATPQMAKSLSQHLCDAFFTSCCVLLPAFSYYRDKMPQYRGEQNLPSSTKVAIASFCAVGARASPHSAVLGIEAFPSDARDHPEAPLLSAGTRRQSACSTLLQQAHTLGFEHGLMDEPTIDNLAGLLALMQMITFSELHPKKSRALLRAAVGHYKELQDAASSREDADEVQRLFGLALYTADSLNSAYARRSPLLTGSDISQYFHHAGIVIPTLPGDDLVAVLRVLLVNPVNRQPNLKTALHLIQCWSAACQRIFAKLAAPAPQRSTEALVRGVQDLFKAIDATRSSILYVQSLVYSPAAHSHSHSHPHFGDDKSAHSHADDHLALSIRSDRDLLDLFGMSFVLLKGARERATDAEAQALDAILGECESRMRKALKVNAFYAKMYTQGADGHMVFHTAFQLELTPDWTSLALQKVGEPGGPATKEDEVSETELSWLIEALQIACYYTPAAERRLAELSPRFVSLETPPIPSNPFPDAVKIGNSHPSPPRTSASAHTPPPGFSLESYSASPADSNPPLPQHYHQGPPNPQSYYSTAPPSSNGSSRPPTASGMSTNSGLTPFLEGGGYEWGNGGAQLQELSEGDQQGEWGAAARYQM